MYKNCFQLVSLPSFNLVSFMGGWFIISLDCSVKLYYIFTLNHKSITLTHEQEDTQSNVQLCAMWVVEPTAFRYCHCKQAVMPGQELEEESNCGCDLCFLPR